MPVSLAGKRETFGHEDVRLALQNDELSDGVHHALETLHSLGTEAGREAIISAMNDRQVPLDTLPADLGEKEYALRLLLEQRRNAALADVFARAQTEVQEGGDHRRYNEFIGKETRGIHKLSAKRAALCAEVLRYCRESDLGEHVQVDAFEDDGAYVFHILRSHHTKKPLAVVAGHAARTTITFRPVHSDILRYDAVVGRLRIAARATSVIDFYRRIPGRILFDDEQFFTGDAVCSLAVLQEQGRAALENHNVFRVGRIRLTECLWERGDRNLIHFRSADCFRTIEELRLPLTEGTLIQAKLKIEVIGKSTRPLTVNIRVPSRIEVSQKTHEDLVDRVLTAVGIRRVAPAKTGQDLWSLHPWRHPVAVWRALFGAETDTLVRNGVLMPIQLESMPHPKHPHAGRVLSAQQLSDGEFYGVSRSSEVPSRSLSSTDFEGLELAPEQFRLYLRSKLGIAAGGAGWNSQGLLELGTIEAGEHRLYLVYALRQPSAGVGERLRLHPTAHILFCCCPRRWATPSNWQTSFWTRLRLQDVRSFGRRPRRAASRSQCPPFIAPRTERASWWMVASRGLGSMRLR
jgi:hypothetical protein